MRDVDDAMTVARESPVWHALPIPEVARALDVDPAVGLSAGEAARRRAELGPNALRAPAPDRGRAFLGQYARAMPVVLVAVGAGSLVLGELAIAIAVLIVTVVNAALGMHRENERTAANAALLALVTGRARVRRDGRPRWIGVEELVLGDVVLVEPGDVVPADGRLLESTALELGESVPSDESAQWFKGTDLVAEPDAPLGERTDMVYMGTRVTGGSGEFVVTGTGMATELGRVSALLAAQRRPIPPWSGRLDAATSRWLAIAGAPLAVTVALGLLRGQTAETVVAAAIAFVVAVLPVSAPVAVAIILAQSVRAIAPAGVRLEDRRAAATLGLTSAIVADDDGMLSSTAAVELVLPPHRFTLDAHGAIRHVGGDPAAPPAPALLPMALTGHRALARLAEHAGLDVEATRAAFPRVAELPFDAGAGLMASFHRLTDAAGSPVVRCFVVGEPEQLLARAGTVVGGGPHPLRVDSSVRERYLDECERMTSRGLRVLGTACCDLPAAGFDPTGDLVSLLDGLTLLALVGLARRPRPAVRAAIAQAQTVGIRVHLVTREHPRRAAALARRLGIVDAEHDGVVARATAEPRLRLVESLRRRGQVVVAVGSGVDDAPALQAADVGVAPADGGPVARAAATAIVAGDGLAALLRAVAHGRTLSENLLRCVRYEAGVLAGVLLACLGSSVLDLAAMPFGALQSLYLHFTVHLSQLVGLGCAHADGDELGRRPRRAPPRCDLVPVAVAAVLLALVTLAVVALAERTWSAATARTMGLATFAAGSVLWSLAVRRGPRSVFSLDTLSDRALLAGAGVSVIAVVLGTQTGLLQRVLETEALELRQWTICVGAAALVLLATERCARARSGVRASAECDAHALVGVARAQDAQRDR